MGARHVRHSSGRNGRLRVTVFARRHSKNHSDFGPRSLDAANAPIPAVPPALPALLRRGPRVQRGGERGDGARDGGQIGDRHQRKNRGYFCHAQEYGHDVVLFFRHCLRSAPASINLYCGRRFVSPSVSETHRIDPLAAGNAGPPDAAAADSDVSLHRAARDRSFHQASARDIPFPAGFSLNPTWRTSRSSRGRRTQTR